MPPGIGGASHLAEVSLHALRRSKVYANKQFENVKFACLSPYVRILLRGCKLLKFLESTPRVGNCHSVGAFVANRMPKGFYLVAKSHALRHINPRKV